ncbi:MAG: HPr family phosphocarrier protein [Pseudomonadota bacterium]
MSEFKAKTKIINKKGLHARAAAEVVNLTAKFQSSISIEVNDKIAATNSLIQLLMLAAAKGSEVTVVAKGEDSQHAASALIHFFENKCLEED